MQRDHLVVLAWSQAKQRKVVKKQACSQLSNRPKLLSQDKVEKALPVGSHMDFCSRCTEELTLHNSRSPGSLPYFEEELFHLSIPHHSSVDVDNEPSMSHSTLNSLSQQINVLLSSHGKSIADPMESQLLYLLSRLRVSNLGFKTSQLTKISVQTNQKCNQYSGL
jgi:hypothetical protein